MAQPEENPSVRGGRRGGQAALHSPRVSAAGIQVYLKGISYPADRQKVIQTAKNNNAPENVMSFLNRLPERQYSYPTDVEVEFGKMK